MAQPAACVFCGAPIEAGEEMSGRPPHAAHARCADAALADDRHWDAVAAATGGDSGDPEDQPAGSPRITPPAGSRAGCLGILVVALLSLAPYGAALGSHLLHRLDVFLIERQRR